MLSRHLKNSRRIRVLALTSTLGVSLVGATGYALAGLSGMTIPKYSIVAGSGTSATATVSPLAGVQVVKFTSSNTAIATVASSIPVQPQGSQAVAPVIGRGAGCVRITAALGTQTRQHDLVVHPASPMTSFTLTVPDQVLVLGGTYSGKITTGALFTNPFSLTSSNPAVVSVPATVQAVRGLASFNMVARQDGCATITVTSRGVSVGKTVRVYDIGG